MHTWRVPFKLGKMLAGHFLVAVHRVKHLKTSRINEHFSAHLCFIFLWSWCLNKSACSIEFICNFSQRIETWFPHVHDGLLKTVNGLNVKAFQGLWARREGKFKGNHLSCLCQVVSPSSWPGSCLNRPADPLPSWSPGPWTGCPTSPWASCSHSYRWAAWSKRTHVHSVLSSEDSQLWSEQTPYNLTRASVWLAVV